MDEIRKKEIKIAQNMYVIRALSDGEKSIIQIFRERDGERELVKEIEVSQLESVGLAMDMAEAELLKK